MVPENITALLQDIGRHSATQLSSHPEWDEIQQKIEQFFIDSNTQLEERKHLLEIDGIKCFPRGDLVAISGKEKCGKTTACRIIATALLKGDFEPIKAVENNLRILWIDTEQARISTRSVSRAVDMMCGQPQSAEHIRYLNLREWGDRSTMVLLLRMMFDSYRPDLVILDGIRDLITDFNDIRESAEIVLECMRLSSGVTAERAAAEMLHERLPCCIACILHQNKPKDDNNMRGHLGTELANKAGEVWESSRDDDAVFTFEQTRSRTRPLDKPITFKVFSRIFTDQNSGKTEELGIPELWGMKEGEAEPELIKTKEGTFAKNEVNIQWMLWKVLDGHPMKWEDLLRAIVSRFGLQWREAAGLKNYVTNTIEKDSRDLLWHYIGPSFAEPCEGA